MRVRNWDGAHGTGGEGEGRQTLSSVVSRQEWTRQPSRHTMTRGDVRSQIQGGISNLRGNLEVIKARMLNGVSFVCLVSAAGTRPSSPGSS